MSEDPKHEGHETPKIDVSKALHEAGHEVEELGFEGIPDTGRVIHAEEHHGAVDTESAVDAAVLGGGSD